jgi:hypothetical protein
MVSKLEYQWDKENPSGDYTVSAVSAKFRARSTNFELLKQFMQHCYAAQF